MELGLIELEWLRREISVLNNTGASSHNEEKIIFAKLDVYAKVLKKALQTKAIESKSPELLKMLSSLLESLESEVLSTSMNSEIAEAKSLIKSATELNP